MFTEENVWASHDQILVETTMSTVPTLLQTIWHFIELQQKNGFLRDSPYNESEFQNIFADLPKGKVEPERPRTFGNLGISRLLGSLIL